MGNFFIKTKLKCVGNENEHWVNYAVSEDERLGFEDLGLYYTLFVQPEGINFSLDYLVPLSSDSRKTTKTILKRLINAGYFFLLRNKETKKKGYLVCDNWETKEDIKKYLEKTLPEWKLLEE